jgi:hypothetical protein
MYPSKVNKIFNQNAPARPTCRNTPKGGSNIAISIRNKSIVTLLFYQICMQISFCLKAKNLEAIKQASQQDRQLPFRLFKYAVF